MSFLRDLLWGKRGKPVTISSSLFSDSDHKCKCSSCQPAKEESDYMKFRLFLEGEKHKEAEEMLKGGYDIETLNDDGKTLLQEASNFGRLLPVIPFLILHGAKFTSSQLSFWLGQPHWNQSLVTKIFDAAIEMGWSDWGYKDNYGGESFLFRACRGGNFKMMRRLAKMGFDFDEENSFGETIKMVIKKTMRDYEASARHCEQTPNLWGEAVKSRRQASKCVEVLELLAELKEESKNAD